MATRISIVVVSYNTKDITDKCLTAAQKAGQYLQKKTGDTAEIIVVDNVSQDDTVAMVKKKHSTVKLLTPGKNTGFTGGNNLGMQEASGDYILLLNSDAFLEEDTLVKCLDFMGSHTDCGVLGCKLTYADGRFQPSAGYLPNPLNTFLWVWGVDTLPIFKQLIPSVHLKSAIDTARPVGWVMGAFMFLKREVWEKTHGFDTEFFMYMEDVDWCKRIADAGLKAWYVPDFSIVHLHGASSSYDMSGPLIKEMQGLIYYFKKHYSLVAPLMKIVIWGGNMARIAAFTIVGKPERAAVYKQIVKSI